MASAYIDMLHLDRWSIQKSGDCQCR